MSRRTDSVAEPAEGPAALRVEEEIVGIQDVVAEELVGISVIMSRAALQIYLHVPPPLRPDDAS